MSLKMTSFDRSHTTSYWSAVVNIPFSSYLTLKDIVILTDHL